MIKKVFNVAILATLFAACSTADYDHFGDIRGMVLDDDTGEPVLQATVTLSPTLKNAYTYTDGAFEFHELEEGNYTITVQKTEYNTNRKTVTINAGETTNVSIVIKKASKEY